MKGALGFVGARRGGFSKGKSVVSGGYDYKNPFLTRNLKITNENGRSEVVFIVSYKDHLSVFVRDRVMSWVGNGERDQKVQTSIILSSWSANCGS